MPIWSKYLVCCIAAYLVGSINFAVIISKSRNKNIQKEGSGNPGTMNMLRSVGKFWGCLTFVLDFLKGVAMGLIGLYVLGDGSVYSIGSAFPIYLLGLCTILGHVFSIFLKFKGGKGVATAIGIFGVGNPIGMLVAFVLLMIYLYFFRIGFLGSLLVVYGLTICDSILYRDDYRVALVLVAISLVITFTHRKNIIRLIRGQENSLSLFRANKKPADTETDNAESAEVNGQTPLAPTTQPNLTVDNTANNEIQDINNPNLPINNNSN